tara:strand:+ start:65200 stop:65484 length:285 start_codon:yes stop_codon:yes gene_type:complete
MRAHCTVTDAENNIRIDYHGLFGGEFFSMVDGVFGDWVMACCLITQMLIHPGAGGTSECDESKNKAHKVQWSNHHCDEPFVMIKRLFIVWQSIE